MKVLKFPKCCEPTASTLNAKLSSTQARCLFKLAEQRIKVASSKRIFTFGVPKQIHSNPQRKKYNVNFLAFKHNLVLILYIGIEIESESGSIVSNSVTHGLCTPWQNTGMGSLSLLQGIFLTQGLNPGLPRCRQIYYIGITLY